MDRIDGVGGKVSMELMGAGDRVCAEEPNVGVWDWEDVNPFDLLIDQRMSGMTGTTALISRAMDLDEAENDSAPCSSRSVSLEAESSMQVEHTTMATITTMTTTTTTTTGRAVIVDWINTVDAALTSRSRSRLRPAHREYSPVLPRRTTKRRSSAQSSKLETDEDNVSGKKKNTKSGVKHTTSNANSGSHSNSESNATSNSSTSISSSDSGGGQPDLAYQIIDPPHPFPFEDLGLQPPAPFCRAEPAGSGNNDVSKTEPNEVVVAVRSKRREMNRVAAKWRCKKDEDRLKSLKTLKAWLDNAVAQYEKSNKRLRETLESLQRENLMLKGLDVKAC